MGPSLPLDETHDPMARSVPHAEAVINITKIAVMHDAGGRFRFLATASYRVGRLPVAGRSTQGNVWRPRSLPDGP